MAHALSKRLAIELLAAAASCQVVRSVVPVSRRATAEEDARQHPRSVALLIKMLHHAQREHTAEEPRSEYGQLLSLFNSTPPESHEAKRRDRSVLSCVVSVCCVECGRVVHEPGTD